MKILNVNFSGSKQHKQQYSNLIVLFLLLLVLVGTLVEQSYLDNQTVDIEETIAQAQGRRKPVKMAEPTKQDLRQMKMAGIVQEKLNFSWYELLAAIEKVKQQEKMIELVAIQPNSAKKEVVINAEAPNLKAMLSFISLLEQQHVLDTVLLINQHHISEKKQNLAFSIKMRWGS